MLLSLGYFLTPTYAVVLAVSLALDDRLDAAFAARRFAGAVGRAALRLELYRDAHLGLDLPSSCANFVGGIILAATSADAVPVMIVARACSARSPPRLLAPRLGRPRRASPLSATDLQEAAPKLFNRYFLLFVAGAGVITASHGFLYGFVSIYWKIDRHQRLGHRPALGLGGGRRSRHLHGFQPALRLASRRRRCLLIAGVAAIVRWIAFPLIWPLGLGVAGFFGVQTLHALSTGAGADRPAEDDRRDRAGRAHGRRARRRLFRQRLLPWRW